MLTRSRYLPDETLHSFIFRICLINGEEQFSDVTNHNVQWLKNLQLNVRTIKYFAEYSDLDLLILMRNSWQAIKSTTIFDNPVEYMSEINTLLRKQPLARRGTHNYPLKYCIDCIRESIKNIGFGYFKSSWHYELAGYCFIHNKALTHFKRNINMQPHEILKTILRGEHPAGSYSLIPNKNSTIEKTSLIYSNKIKSIELSFNNEDYIYIADCLKAEIKNFIRTCTVDLPKMALISDTFNKTKIKKPYKEGYLFQDNVLAKIIQCFFTVNFEPFITFWQKNAAKKIVYCGSVKTKDIFEFLFIYQNTDKCNRCEYFSCPVKHHYIEDAELNL
ncbi:TniQ family protein [Salmonella enterica]|nr:TniQ family protein [Salmonella enterica]